MTYSAIIKAEPSLVGYWKLDETSGTVAADSSTNSNSGTIAGTPTLGANGLVFEPSGKCIDFDGVDDYISLPAALNTTVCSNLFSIEVWASNASVPGANEGRLFQSNDRASDIAGVDNEDRVLLSVFDSTIAIGDMVSISPDWSFFVAGKKYHIVYCQTSATNLDLYVNGVLHQSLTVAGCVSIAPQTPIIGAISNPGIVQYTTNKYQHVAIYNTALSAAKVSDHYNAGIADRLHKAGLDLLPDLYLPLNEASGVPQDWSGNDNNGTITGDITQGAAGMLASDASTAYSFAGVDGEIAITHPASTTTYSLFAVAELDSATGEFKILEDGGVGHWSIKDGKQNLNYSSADHLATSALPTAQRVIVGLSCDAGAVTFYTQGVSDGTATGGIALNFETLSDALTSFDGKLQCVFRFPTALSAANHLALYDAAVTMFGITGTITESLSATEFFVRASQLDTGAFIGDTVMQSDNTYTLDFGVIAGYEDYADEVLLTALPKTGKRRLNSEPYIEGNYYIPADVSTNDHIYKVTVGGTSAASEPALDQAGGTTVDGDVTVQDMGVTPTPSALIDYATTFET